MFVLQINCNTVEEAERILAALKHSADPSAVKQVAEQVAYTAPGGLSDADSPAAKYFPNVTHVEAKAVVVEPKKPRGRPRREVAPPLTESAAPVATATEGTSPSQPDVAGNSEPAPQTYTLDDAKAALRGVQQRSGTNDLAKPLALLEKFGAARISEVKPEAYPEFIAACEAA